MKRKYQAAFFALVLIFAMVSRSGLVPIILMAGPFFVDAGKAMVTNFLANATGVNQPKWTAMGTGAGPADATATALTAEVESRATGTVSRVTTTVTNDTYQVVGTQTATAGRAITEVGLFDASAAGNALILSTISVINLAIGDSLQVTYKLKFA